MSGKTLALTLRLASRRQSQEEIVSGAFEDTGALTKLVDQLLAARKITHQQYQSLSQLVLADGSVDEDELRQINRLFDAVQNGRIKVVD